MTYMIAIVGRPNVGKSRLYNRLVDTEMAIVHDEPGVTRDRQYGEGAWYDREYTVVDTGGLMPQSGDPVMSAMRQQIELAVDQADAILFVVDGRDGLTAADEEIAELLRRTDKPVFGVVNKVDTWTDQEEYLLDFYELGHELYPISAEHGMGVEELMDDVTDPIAPSDEEEDAPPFARVAVVGRPNVGKSSLVNAFLGEDRLLTSDVPGTTRDAIDTRIVDDDREYLMIDTAGLRKKSKVVEKLEEFAVMHAIRSIDRADIALVVLDPTRELTHQDKQIASLTQRRGRGCVLVVNKWDLIEKTAETAGEFAAALRREMPFVDHAPIAFVSAVTGLRLGAILDGVDEVFDNYKTRISTSEVNDFLEVATGRHSPPTHNNKRPKFYYATQVGTRPPSFMFSVNASDAVAPSYRKYLVGQLREAFGFEGVPIKTVFRER